MLGKEGYYRVYRNFPEEDGTVDRMLMGTFFVKDGEVHIVSDYDSLLEKIFPEGPFDDIHLGRMRQLEQSPYYDIIHEQDYQDGKHPDYLNVINPAKLPDWTGAGD